MNRAVTGLARRRQHWRTESTTEHYVECYFNDDPCDEAVCSTCGEDW